MTGVSAVASLKKPHLYYNEFLGNPSYETLLSKNFGDWVDLGRDDQYVVSPVEREVLDNVYSEVASHTYLHRPSGRRIMLTIGYVAEIRGVRQVHRPESCYSSRGFKISEPVPESLKIGNSNINLFRLTAIKDDRKERITYWIRVGDRTIGWPPIRVNAARMNMALHGYIADGLLFRISEITVNERSPDQLQNKFIADFLGTYNQKSRTTFVGNSSGT